MSGEVPTVGDLPETSDAERTLEGGGIADTGNQNSRQMKEPERSPAVTLGRETLSTCGDNLLQETKLLRDTLDLLWNHTSEQRQLCDQLKQENEYLQDYISNLMTSSNVLDK
ncbi:SLO1 (YER180C-A) [Zygosaccharomyces parabailii]|uniref:BN860_05138g1_1 n=1 Tax=Zygosaccharomyces bailii (strain CLIB 213 / ATCC 58445 / CBS 680 / BCRC 21525 / NBRC 1098 / NCYC 1416 / NRRL Y-2227) TaxID=1333698 RepID=A0A8J2T3G3_ZYGB2|nr:SLO1 (YER180C-A) [Zygosaccharomyces parabailii]CDF87383.1 BN860_05138g1_1 [Zygosaccharomyces bailii CLIB 213]CDH15551.1 uncharacterized protein ZBAI_07338 [Zygosaccharomyces bailii ISA1307]SJM85021.1 uncharacterized protein ZBIST_1998 [Zygosaccharomyces bailii]